MFDISFQPITFHLTGQDTKHTIINIMRIKILSTMKFWKTGWIEFDWASNNIQIWQWWSYQQKHCYYHL